MKKITISLCAVFCLYGVFFAGNYFFKEPKVSLLHGIKGYDSSDYQQVVGANENVFIGKVIKKVGQGKRYEIETRYEVQVVTSIKGELDKMIIVNQLGGYEVALTGEKYLLEFEDLPLVKEGETYVFGTLYNKTENFYQMADHFLIKGESDQLKKEKEFKEAFKNQITPKI